MTSVLSGLVLNVILGTSEWGYYSIRQTIQEALEMADAPRMLRIAAAQLGPIAKDEPRWVTEDLSGHDHY